MRPTWIARIAEYFPKLNDKTFATIELIIKFLLDNTKIPTGLIRPIRDFLVENRKLFSRNFYASWEKVYLLTLFAISKLDLSHRS